MGRKMLTTIDDLMHVGEHIPIVYQDSGISVIISEMTQKRLGVTLVTDKKKQLKGIITDGDLRRIRSRPGGEDRGGRGARGVQPVPARSQTDRCLQRGHPRHD